MSGTRRSLAVAVLVAQAWAAGPAAAHSGAGGLALEQATPVAESQIRYVVRLTSVNDGHGAVKATVTATLVVAGGAAQTPVPLTAVDEDGRYAATLTFPAPGAWTVRFTAVKPPAVLEQAATIAPPTTTSTAVPTTTTTTALPGSGDDPGQELPDGGSGGSGKGPLVAGLLVAGAVAAGGGAWAAKRRKA